MNLPQVQPPGRDPANFFNVLKILGPKGPTEMDPRIFFGCQNQLPPKNAVEVYRMFNVAMLLTLSSARTTIRTAGPLWTSGGI